MGRDYWYYLHCCCRIIYIYRKLLHFGNYQQKYIMMEIFHTIFTSNLFTSTFWQRKGDDNHVVAVAEKENEIKSEYILSLTECQYYPLCQAWLTLPPIVGPCMQCTSYINLYCAVLCWGKTILLPLFVCLISWDLSNFLFPFLRLSERFLQDLVMIAVLHITCNLGSVANCIFFSVETYKWPYEKLPKYTRMIVKRAPWCSHIFHELFNFSPVDTFWATRQGRNFMLIIYFLCRAFTVFLPHQDWEWDIPIGEMTLLIDIHCLGPLHRPPTIKIHICISDKNNSEIRCPPRPVQTMITRSQRRRQR